MRTFTFGFDHKHPITGESLARHYIQVPGEDDLSRRFMHAVFGRNWSMQYKSPEQFKYPKNMVELKWSQDLLDLISADDRDLFESVTGDRLEVLFGLEKKTDQLIDAKKAERDLLVDEYFDTLKDQPPVETHTGTPVVEYGLKMTASMQVFPNSPETELIYPVAKQARHAMKYGGKVYRRRVMVIEEWVAVTEAEVDELCKEYDKHTVPTERQTKLP